MKIIAIAITLVATLMISNIALTAGAVVMTDLICKDPRDSIDTKWINDKYQTADIFFMQNDGAMIQLNGSSVFDDAVDIYVVSHGSENEIGNIPKADFASYLKLKHPTAPKVVYFDSCSTASGNDTVLKLTNEKYNNSIGSLFGPKGGCQLVGDGDSTVANAKNKYNATLAVVNSSAIVGSNIMNVWNNKEYKNTNKTWAKACDGYVNSVNAQYADLNQFRIDVYEYFLNRPIDPVTQSDNYGLLIKWNVGGDDFFQCGNDNNTPCP